MTGTYRFAAMVAGRIGKLTAGASHQIVAEQVIVDLSSAVKEAVENALDARPKHIEIVFFNYGMDRVVVEDDGRGIDQVDMQEIASSRYATSKIVDDSDLETSQSYGFRGEALHSLVKLSDRVVITSASNDQGTGLCKTFRGCGLHMDMMSKPRTRGTTVSIEGLFSAISVRRQDWFKRKGAILSHAVYVIQGYAVMTRDVRFSVYHVKETGEKALSFSTGGKSMQSNYIECFTALNRTIEHIDKMLVINDQECRLDGLLVSHKGQNKSRFVIFVNNKPFESPKWSKLLQQMLKKNLYSGMELFASIHLPGSWIDFNVTPDKRSMYILNEAALMDGIVLECENVIRRSLTVGTRATSVPSLAKTESSGVLCSEEHCGSCLEPWLLSVEEAVSVKLTKEDILKLVPIGQFNNGFIVCSRSNGNATELFAVDQHAADERVRFEEISAHHTVHSQRLVAPLRLNVLCEDEDTLLKRMDTILAAGFIIRQNADTFWLEAVPSFHGTDATVEDLSELIAFLKDHGLLYRNLCPRFQRVLASKACRSAIMIGSPLTWPQMRKLLDKLAETEYPWICAHGRPTVQFLKRLGANGE